MSPFLSREAKLFNDRAVVFLSLLIACKWKKEEFSINNCHGLGSLHTHTFKCIHYKTSPTLRPNRHRLPFRFSLFRGDVDSPTTENLRGIMMCLINPRGFSIFYFLYFFTSFNRIFRSFCFIYFTQLTIKSNKINYLNVI